MEVIYTRPNHNKLKFARHKKYRIMTNKAKINLEVLFIPTLYTQICGQTMN